MRDMSHRDWIISRLKPHTCTESSCGYHPSGRNAHHDGCLELSSDDFIRATLRVSHYVAPD